MQLPLKLLESIKDITGFDKEAFQGVHESGEQVTSVRLNPFKPVKQFPNPPAGWAGFPIPDSKIPWCETGFYLEKRPSFTFDPIFHAGCYYVQEASSMFLEQALKQTTDLSKPLKVLDLCAAPGGKSTHIQSLISKDSLLVSNEVIRSRVNILKDNIIKWGCGNVVVTNNDPKDFARLENYFDVIVVDAPCSGSGLFRRDPEAIEEWSEGNVQLCSQRQQRILADVLPALKKNGVLIYSTCSYSKEEDENITDWLIREFSLDYSPLTIRPDWRIADTNKGYRFWPDKLQGEGFFLACFRKTAGDEVAVIKSRELPGQLNKKELELIKEWVETDTVNFVRNKNTVYAWPKNVFNDFNYLLEKMNVIYSGARVGELIRDKLVPDHALAMSSLLKINISKTEVSYEQAVRYLQRKELITGAVHKGWNLVTYLDRPLGWANVLPGRVNNYYPKELRILKDK
ncbi:MAG: Fmu (Sun) domain protein [Sphingobacteriales bacterium]|nr:Fmu (Sun) domain protein [Sphingobacteriales bacterium]